MRTWVSVSLTRSFGINSSLKLSDAEEAVSRTSHPMTRRRGCVS